MLAFDESIEGNIYNQQDTVYTLERLELNEVKLSPPLGLEVFSVPLFIEFNGTVEVTSENEDIYMYSSHAPNWVDPTKAVGADSGSQNSVKIAVERYVNFNPLPTPIATFHGGSRFGTITEWYLNVNAYSFDNEDSPIIRAQLRILDIRDTHEQATDYKCFSVELISYEYSDIYKFMDEIVDDDYE